ncbi:hypothetical protein [Caulobacter hibisci]|uniref:Uncharacterized protein n=1 Tax=Caulobacter hibisci TaxID=2035993 RepID=A0ABS0T3V2_9CAUL|nr:hypothetical protein [Caulobacter hibisci]MBI1686451.1 hypothetical protein [Caulobacter hibisci]
MHDLNTTTRIELSNRPGQFAVLCEAGAAFLAANDIRSLFICLDGARRYGYVSHYSPNRKGQMDTLARGLLGAGKGEQVRYRDGNVLNLRLNNLKIVRTYSANRRTQGGVA